MSGSGAVAAASSREPDAHLVVAVELAREDEGARRRRSCARRALPGAAEREAPDLEPDGAARRAARPPSVTRAVDVGRRRRAARRRRASTVERDVGAARRAPPARQERAGDSAEGTLTVSTRQGRPNRQVRARTRRGTRAGHERHTSSDPFTAAVHRRADRAPAGRAHVRHQRRDRAPPRRAAGRRRRGPERCCATAATTSSSTSGFLRRYETFALVRLAREWDRLAASGCAVHVGRARGAGGRRPRAARGQRRVGAAPVDHARAARAALRAGRLTPSRRCSVGRCASSSGSSGRSTRSWTARRSRSEGAISARCSRSCSHKPTRSSPSSGSSTGSGTKARPRPRRTSSRATSRSCASCSGGTRSPRAAAATR